MLEVVNLESIDDFSQKVYQQIQETIEARQDNKTKKKQFLVKKLVS